MTAARHRVRVSLVADTLRINDAVATHSVDHGPSAHVLVHCHGASPWDDPVQRAAELLLTDASRAACTAALATLMHWPRVLVPADVVTKEHSLVIRNITFNVNRLGGSCTLLVGPDFFGAISHL